MNLHFKEKIDIIKNEFTLFTVDKNGKNTGKSFTGRNMWVENGYRYFWGAIFNSTYGFTESYALPSATSGNTPTPSGRCAISSSSSPITIASTDVDVSELVTTNTQLSVRNNVYYPQVSEVTRNGTVYLQFKHLFSYSFGILNQNVRQIGIRFFSTPGNIHCATTLPDNFPVTNEEQLLVEYSFFIRKSYLSIEAEGTLTTVAPIFNTQNINLNGNPATPLTITFRRHSCNLTNTSPTNNRVLRFAFVPRYSGFDSRIFFNTQATLYNYCTITDLAPTNNYRNLSYQVSIDIPASPVNDLIITDIYMSNNYNSPIRSGHLNFNPALVKTADDRIAISYIHEVEFNEIVF